DTSTGESTTGSTIIDTSADQNVTNNTTIDTSIDQHNRNNDDGVPSEQQRVKVDNKEITRTDLNGYELPLLNSFKDKNEAALVSESMNLIGKNFDTSNTTQKGFTQVGLSHYLYKKLFNMEIGKTFLEQFNFGTENHGEYKIGDILFWNKNNKEKLGIYLGQNKYLFVDNTNKKDSERKIKINEINKNDLPVKVVSINNKHLSEYGEQVLKNYQAPLNIVQQKYTQEFIDKIKDDAIQISRQNDLFASIMIAQAVLESGSGASVLSASPYFNIFGIKGTKQTGVNFQTQEDNGKGHLTTVDSYFKTYRSYIESLKDYASLLKNGLTEDTDFYKDSWVSVSKNYLTASKSLVGKYATDSQYNLKINSIIAAYHLTKFDKIKKDEPRNTTSVILSSLNEIPQVYKEKMIFPEYNKIDYNLSHSYPKGQCTWYVFNRMAQLGRKVDDYMGNGGEWANKAQQLSYKVSSTPQVGSAVSFHAGVAGSSSQYGHVAFVEAVGEQGILVSECNVVSDKVISYRIIPNSIARSSQVDYIMPK
ncbi:CHAP domain-containing protein, partial [Enterococcus faecium]|nr:CHAP domain-containing protein [Enterococcus faecium]